MNNLVKKCIVLTLSLAPLLALSACEGISDEIRNWGKRNRLEREKRLERGELEKWERDLNLSRAKTQTLYKDIQGLLKENDIQGRLNWKIGRAFCEAGRYEQASAHYKAAVKKLNAEVAGGKKNLFEKSLPYFQEALGRAKIEANLLFDAGLCYANASRSLGWERDRWLTAVYLFEAMRKLDPKDLRAPYQLALLYGKTLDKRHRDIERALALLEGVLVEDKKGTIAPHFLYAHLLATKGDFEKGKQEYEKIKLKLKTLHDEYILPGNLEENRQFQKAVKNIEELEYCISGSNLCAIDRSGIRVK